MSITTAFNPLVVGIVLITALASGLSIDASGSQEKDTYYCVWTDKNGTHKKEVDALTKCIDSIKVYCPKNTDCQIDR